MSKISKKKFLLIYAIMNVYIRYIPILNKKIVSFIFMF